MIVFLKECVTPGTRALLPKALVRYFLISFKSFDLLLYILFYSFYMLYTYYLDFTSAFIGTHEIGHS